MLTVEQRRSNRLSAQKAWRDKNKAAVAEYGRKHYSENRGRYSDIHKRYYRTNKAQILTRTKDSHYRRQYGMSLEQVQVLLSSQGGKCAICASVPESFNLDHDHKTGKVRGILCGVCNRGIGLMGDSPEILRSAANYIESYLEKKP